LRYELLNSLERATSASGQPSRTSDLVVHTIRRDIDARGAVQLTVAMAEEPTPTEPEEQQQAAAGADAPAQEAAPPAEAEQPPAAEAEPPAAEQPAAEEPTPEPAAEQPAPAAEQPAPAADQPAPAEPPTPEPAAEQPAPDAEQPAPEQPPTPEPAAPAEQAAPAAEEQAADAPAAEQQQQQQRPQGKPRRDRPRRDRGQRPRRDRAPRQPQQQRASGPLPFQELRDAATAVVDLFGERQALRDAFSALGDKERRDLSRLVAEDGDWRVRARNIAAGSLGAGRVGKALAAQQISMARVEDLWTLTLSKEEAAERQSRIRNARRRDERRAQRDAEREQRSDRVSRADLEKAQDGRVGAQIRIVIGGRPSDRRRKGEDEPKGDDPKQGSDNLLDRLGY
jgi:hypothetical protein